MKTKSNPQTPRILIKNAVLLTVAVLAVCASPTVALAAECLVETNWIDGTASWFVAANWDHGVPASGIGAQINNGGTVSAASVYVFPSGTLTGNATVNITANYGVTVDGTLHPSGTLSITGNTSGNLTLHGSAATLCNVVPASAENVPCVSRSVAQWSLSRDHDRQFYSRYKIYSFACSRRTDKRQQILERFN